MRVPGKKLGGLSRDLVISEKAGEGVEPSIVFHHAMVVE